MITGTQVGVAYTSLAQNIYTAEAIGDAVAVPAGASRCDLTGLLSPTDAENPANTATVSLDSTSATNPGPNDWTDGSEPWGGGTKTDKNGNPLGPNYPSIGLSFSGVNPNGPITFVRVRVTPGLALSIGGQVVFS